MDTEELDNGQETRRVTTADLATPAGATAGTGADVADTGSDAEAVTPLFPQQDVTGFRSRWQSIQTSFVDEPRRSVEAADELVAEVMQRLAASFADARAGLEAEWGRGGDVSTEGLRVALQRYRSFFERLLTT